MHTIRNTDTTTVLSKLHREASSEKGKVMKGLLKSVFRELKPSDLEEAYIAISKEQGEYIYNLLIEKKVKNIVEFGTSFGISTIYLAAAAIESDGTVITTELLDSKAKIALKNFKNAHVNEVIDMRVGDAMETLKNTQKNIDFLLLDGWNDLYLSLVKMLEPNLKKGALIYTDNINFPGSKPFVQYVRSNPDKFHITQLTQDKGGSALIELMN